MLIFVSYSRRDNDLDSLRRIERRIARHGQPYIDDLYDNQGVGRLASVLRALRAADFFVLVDSPNYLKTAWTTAEYRIALMRGSPLIKIMKDGTLVDESVAWISAAPLGFDAQYER
jgi:TIR domain